MHGSAHYDWLKDPEYKAQFEAIQLQAANMLEDEAIRQAFRGVEKPITVASKREISTNTAIPC